MIQKETKQKREKRKTLDEDVRTEIEKKNQKKKTRRKTKNTMKRQNLTRKKTRNQMKEQRAARTSEAENAIQTFLQMIKQEPTYIWSVCHRLMYRECIVMYNVNVF